MIFSMQIINQIRAWKMVRQVLRRQHLYARKKQQKGLRQAALRRNLHAWMRTPLAIGQETEAALRTGAPPRAAALLQYLQASQAGQEEAAAQRQEEAAAQQQQAQLGLGATSRTVAGRAAQEAPRQEA
jgi:hypothetical protein